MGIHFKDLLPKCATGSDIDSVALLSKVMHMRLLERFSRGYIAVGTNDDNANTAETRAAHSAKWKKGNTRIKRSSIIALVVAGVVLLLLLIKSQRSRYPILNSLPPGGAILWSGKRTIASKNGLYELTLQNNGNLILTSKDGTPLWWTSTGDNWQPNSHAVTLRNSDDGQRQIMEIKVKSENDTWKVIWHSDLEPQCHWSKQNGTAEEAKEAKEVSQGLDLSNNGRLQLIGTCDLYNMPRTKDAIAVSNRSLAVIVAGLFRTLSETCESHRRSIITPSSDSSFTRTDVFAYIIYEDSDISPQRGKKEIEDIVRQCYGSNLRTVIVSHVSDIAEQFSGDKLISQCGERLNRLNDQLKTLDNAGKMWWEWSIRNGFLHDTVLRIRPDTEFRSNEAAKFWSQKDLGHGTLVLPHPANEHYYYCATMTGRVGVGMYYLPSAIFFSRLFLTLLKTNTRPNRSTCIWQFCRHEPLAQYVPRLTTDSVSRRQFQPTSLS